MDLPYRAPWSVQLATMTALGSFVLLGESIFFALISRVPGVPPLLGLLPVPLLGVWLVCAALTIRGYGFEPGTLLVRRLWWTTRVPLDGVHRVVADPAAVPLVAMGVGNGGLFAISGWRRVHADGWCRV